MNKIVDITGQKLVPSLFIYYAREHLYRAKLKFARIETVNHEKNKIGVSWRKNGKIITVGDVNLKVVVPAQLSQEQFKQWYEGDSDVDSY